jgi:hypothetical protein
MFGRTPNWHPKLTDTRQSLRLLCHLKKRPFKTSSTSRSTGREGHKTPKIELTATLTDFFYSLVGCLESVVEPELHNF